MFSSAVQFGFVVGTIVSAVIVLADRIDPVRFFTLLSLIAGRVINPRSARSWFGRRMKVSKNQVVCPRCHLNELASGNDWTC
ncbi:MAG: hypothetical protein QGH07_16565 [Alphaproteobacteria bacterium]|jgi:hypothetical protein|nr:hypothetical protein [Alphaproteobacteria bacterium]MEC9183123.1 hypothetical protein [Pseudomonadota bacterium]